MVVPKITIEFERHVEGPVYVYYELTKYYQNHMRYVNSRSADQLMGEVIICVFNISITCCDSDFVNRTWIMTPYIQIAFR